MSMSRRKVSHLHVGGGLIEGVRTVPGIACELRGVVDDIGPLECGVAAEPSLYYFCLFVFRHLSFSRRNKMHEIFCNPNAL